MRISVAIPFLSADDDYRTRSYAAVCAQWQALGPDVEIVSTSHGLPLNRAAARNAAVRHARHEIVALVDADTVFVDPTPVRHAYDYVRTHPGGWALPHTTYWTASPSFTDAWYDTQDFSIGAPGTFEHRFTDNICGILIMHQSLFYRVGGYDERFRGWGYEDNAFATALATLAGAPHRVDGAVVHLWHPRPEGDFNQPHIAHNQQLWTHYERARANPTAMQTLIETR